MKGKVEPTIEEILQEAADYTKRDALLNELRAWVQKALNPREVTSVGGGVTIKHFLPTPKPPLAPIARGGEPGEPDPKEQAAYQDGLMAVDRQERELTDAAQLAKNAIPELLSWLQDLGRQADRLLIAKLSEEDCPDVLAFKRPCDRWTRTCETWIEKVRFSWTRAWQKD